MAANRTITVADETCCCAQRSSTEGNAIMVTESRSTQPRARPRGSLSRFHRITGIQSSAASRKRAAAPRKGGTYSANESAATQVVPQTMPRDARANQCLKRAKIIPQGLKSVCESSQVERSHGATNQWMPHISLVFREMWETTDLDLAVPRRASKNCQIGSRGIPHLAKNERDVGHPRLVVGTELGPASSHTRSEALYCSHARTARLNNKEVAHIAQPLVHCNPLTGDHGSRRRRRHPDRDPGCDAAGGADLRGHPALPAGEPQPVRHRRYHPRD